MIRAPKPATLARYGLTEAEWLAILERQGGVCFVCQKEPSSGRLCVDHIHVKGWSKMPPEKRKLYCRGLLCFFCNHRFLARGMTVEKAERVAQYLRAFAARLMDQAP